MLQLSVKTADVSSIKYTSPSKYLAVECASGTSRLYYGALTLDRVAPGRLLVGLVLTTERRGIDGSKDHIRLNSLNYK